MLGINLYSHVNNELKCLTYLVIKKMTIFTLHFHEQNRNCFLKYISWKCK